MPSLKKLAKALIREYTEKRSFSETNDDKFRAMLYLLPRSVKDKKLHKALLSELKKYNLADLIAELPGENFKEKLRLFKAYFYFFKIASKNASEDDIEALHGEFASVVMLVIDFIAPNPQSLSQEENPNYKNARSELFDILTNHKQQLIDICEFPEAEFRDAISKPSLAIEDDSKLLVIQTEAQSHYGEELPTEQPNRFSQLNPELKKLADDGKINYRLISQAIDQRDPIHLALHPNDPGSLEEMVQLRLALSQALGVSIPLDESNETRIDDATQQAREQLEEALRVACDYAASSQNEPRRDVLLATRPPGHHAADGSFIHGFCIDNNAFAYLLRLLNTPVITGEQRKILVFDSDIHSGDGTVELLKKLLTEHPEYKEQIRFVNLFSVNHFPYEGECNAGLQHDDSGCLFNIGLSLSEAASSSSRKRKREEYSVSSDADYLRISAAVLSEIGQTFKPTDVVLSLGTDGHHQDVMGGPLSEEAFSGLTSQLLASKPRSFTAIMEGGYNPKPVAKSVMAVITALGPKAPALSDSSATTFSQKNKRARPDQTSSSSTPQP